MKVEGMDRGCKGLELEAYVFRELGWFVTMVYF